MSKVTVIGIDPASSQEPSKFTYCYDGNEFHRVKAKKLQKWVSEWSKSNYVLVCWDSPLLEYRKADRINKLTFTKREIEKFLSGNNRQRGGSIPVVDEKHRVNTPKGINTQGFAQVQHWGISQRIIGYPDMGGEFYETAKRPFNLVHQQDDKPVKPGQYLVEVHPAIALWWWLRMDPTTDLKDLPGFNYKSKGGKCANEYYRRLLPKLKKLSKGKDVKFPKVELILSDGHLDAFIAYFLGILWLNDGKAILIGNRLSGSILLPTELNKHWENFSTPKKESKK